LNVCYKNEFRLEANTILFISQSFVLSLTLKVLRGEVLAFLL
jgi:hypothetical protein